MILSSIIQLQLPRQASAAVSSFSFFSSSSSRSLLLAFQPSHISNNGNTSTSSSSLARIRMSSSNDDDDDDIINHLESVNELENDFYVLRHGQSEANVEKLIASNPDIACNKYGLSPVGKEQAKQAGQDIIETYNKSNNNYSGILIISSDLLRAKETSQIVLNEIIQYNNENSDNKIPIYENSIQYDIRLRERNFGNYDLTSDDNYNKVWENDKINASHTIENVESVNTVMKRVTQCVIEYNNIISNYMIICVAHGDVLQILQTSFLKLSGTKHRTVQHLQTATLRSLTLSTT